MDPNLGTIELSIQVRQNSNDSKELRAIWNNMVDKKLGLALIDSIWLQAFNLNLP